MLHRLLSFIWRFLPPALKRRVVWLFSAKFALGVSGVVTNSEREVLLLKHRYWKGQAWGLPSGSVKRGETVAAALMREVREETRMEVQTKALIHVGMSSPLRVEFVWLARHASGAPLVNDSGEVLEARFFSPAELPENMLASHREIIQRYLNQPSGSQW